MTYEPNPTEQMTSLDATPAWARTDKVIALNEHEVEVVVYLAPDGLQMVVGVIVDGKPRNVARRQVIHPDSGPFSLVQWREQAWRSTREGSPAFIRTVDEFYRLAETDENAEADINPARCPQPNIMTGRDLLPRLWFTEGQQHPSTLRAAHGAKALRLFLAQAPRRGELPALNAVSVQCYRSPSVADLLLYLFADLRHLAEAYKIRLEGEQIPDDRLAADLLDMVAALRTTASTVWAETLGESGHTLAGIEEAAMQRYLDQVSATAPVADTDRPAAP